MHFRGTCYVVKKIVCRVPMTSEWKPGRKSNPRAFFTAQIATVHIARNGVATLE